MENLTGLKEDVHKACWQKVQARIQQIEQRLIAIREARDQETKSSVGDKYETGRAMMQIEEGKAQAQLANAAADRDALERIDQSKIPERVASGVLVQTDKAKYYISIGLGKIQIGEEIVYCISAKAPIAQAMMGQTMGAAILFQGRKQTIIALA